MNMALNEIITEILQCIALNLDPPSLVSFSLACHSFECKVFSEEDETKKIPRTAPQFGILGIPRTARGFGVCLESIKYDHRALFDYWTNEVKINVVVKNKNAKMQMLQVAGSLSLTDSTMWWIGKIYTFIYSRPKMARCECLQAWRALASGIAASNNIEKYELMVAPQYPIPPPRQIGDEEDDGDIEEEDEDHSDIRYGTEHFQEALNAKTFDFALYLAKRLIHSWEYDYDGDDEVPVDTFSSEEALCTALDTNPDALQWFLDHIPVQTIKSQKLSKLQMLIEELNSTDMANVIFTHSLFADLPDDEIEINKFLLPKVALVILSHRPGLFPMLLKSLVRSEELDPFTESYIKKLSYKEFVDIFKDCRPTLAVAKKLMEIFPRSEDFDDIFEALYGIFEFVPVVKLLANPTPPPRFFEFLIMNYGEHIHELLGEGLFSDEAIVEAIKRKKQEPASASKAGNVRVKPKTKKAPGMKKM